MAASVDVSELRQFFNAMSNAAKGGFKKEMQLFLEATAFDFLRCLQDTIIQLKVMNTRLLLHSFMKGSYGNIWKVEDGGNALEVGSWLDYAQHVEDGHWMNPQGVEKRFVPGHWGTHGFVYDTAAKGGMMVHQQYIPGKHYFATALRAFEPSFRKSAEAKLQEWLDKYFKF